MNYVNVFKFDCWIWKFEDSRDGIFEIINKKRLINYIVVVKLGIFFRNGIE